MKKIIALILTMALAFGLLTGCAGTTVVIGECTCPCVTEDAAPAEPAPAPEAAPQVPTEDTNVEITADLVKTGLSVSTNIGDTVAAAADANGAVKYDVTLAAVTVDDQGVIRSCVIDSIPATLEFDATGTITSDITAPVLTKN